jgi:hypothetical protein
MHSYVEGQGIVPPQQVTPAGRQGPGSRLVLQHSLPLGQHVPWHKVCPLGQPGLVHWPETHDWSGGQVETQVFVAGSHRSHWDGSQHSVPQVTRPAEQLTPIHWPLLQVWPGGQIFGPQVVHVLAPQAPLTHSWKHGSVLLAHRSQSGSSTWPAGLASNWLARSLYSLPMLASWASIWRWIWSLISVLIKSGLILSTGSISARVPHTLLRVCPLAHTALAASRMSSAC